MNRQQIILPIVTILVAVFIVGMVHGRKQARYYTRARSFEIGASLIKNTNSPLVVTVEPNLRTKLTEFLGQPARVEKVLLGDERAPIGDGRASSQVWLINDRQERIAIRLRQDEETDKFHILGFWTPTTGPTDPSR